MTKRSQANETTAAERAEDAVKPKKTPAKKAAAAANVASAEAKPAAKKTAAKKPAAEKTAVKKTTRSKVTNEQPVPSSSSAPQAAPASERTIPEISPEQRRHYVEVAAYFIAERRGFLGGSEMEDWVQAEAEIDRLLREGILKP